MIFKIQYPIALLVTAIFILLASQSIHSQTLNTSLTLSIKNIKSEEGNIIINIFRKNDDIFGKPFIYKKVSARKNLQVIIKKIPFAEYAIQIIHDKNGNGKLDHSWGFPSEPFGYSNNWKFSLLSGMPSFKKTKFSFSEHQNKLSISLQTL